MPRVETIVPAAAEANESAKADLYGGTVLRLPASKLLLRTNARPGDAPADEPRRIESLAASMRATGQIMPLVVDCGGADEWFVVAGARRLAAARTIDEHYMLDCIVRKEGTDALRVAIHENTRRRGYNPLQYARLIAAVRADKGFTGTKEIAAYMGCSRAQVQQHERLLAKPDDMSDTDYRTLLDDLTGKNLRAGAAFWALTHVEPAKTGKVMARAAEIAQAENAARPSRKQKSATDQPEAPATQPRAGKSQHGASESKAEPVKTSLEPVKIAKRVFDALKESYSADKIPDGKIRKPVTMDGYGLLVCTGSGSETCECYRLLTASQYEGLKAPPATTYREKLNNGGDLAQRDPNGFYHRMVVTSGGVIYVLFGPPLVFEAFEANAETTPAAPVVQKRHVERAAKEAKAVKKNAPKARGRAAVSAASGVTRTLPDLRKLFDTLRGTSYPDPMRAFISKVNCWWSGECTDKDVTQQWSQVAMLVEDGLKLARRATPPAKKKAGRK